MNIYRENLKDGRILEIPYNLENIKETCASCGRKINGDLVKNYELRGNFCGPCSTRQF